MGESIQKRLGRVRPPRVQITYDVEVGDAIVKKELPFVMGIMADLAGDRTVREDLGLPPLAEYKLRTFAAVDRDNFDDIMKTVAPALKLSGLDRFITEDASAAWREGGVEPEKAAFSCALRFEKLDDFRPECLVKNVETLAAICCRILPPSWTATTLYRPACRRCCSLPVTLSRNWTRCGRRTRRRWLLWTPPVMP